MPQRVIGLWMVLVGVLGVILVAAFVLVGKDARQASACGPRWKRKLLATGLMLLTAVGIVGCDSNASVTPDRTSIVQDAALDTLLKDPRWIEYRTAWDRAEDIAFGRIEAMPIYSDGKAAAVVALTKAGTNLDSLARRGLITDVEHRYLECERSILTGTLKETPVYTKAIRWMVTFDGTLGRIEKRTAYLKKLANCKVVPKAAWEIVRKAIVRDMKVIETATGGDRAEEAIVMEGEAEPDVDGSFARIRQYIDKIDKLSKSTDLCIDKSWDAFEEGYSRIAEIPQGPAMDLQPDNSAWMGDGFRSAQSNLKALKSSDLMPEPMYALLDAELDTLYSVFSSYFGESVKDTSDMFEGIALSAALVRMKLRREDLNALAASESLRPRVVDNALAMANADFQSVFSDDMRMPEDMEQLRAKYPWAKSVLDSGRTSFLAVRKKIAQCDLDVKDLGRQYHWVRLQEIWLKSEYLWEVRVGGYPYNDLGDRHATALVVEAREHVKSLQAAGLLEQTEARLLVSTFDDLCGAVGYIRGSEDYFSMCYDPGGGFSLGDESPEQFRRRLELLEKAQIHGKLHPRVLGTLLYGMERMLLELNFDVENPGPSEVSTVSEAEAVLRIERLKTVLHKRREQLTTDKTWREFTQTLQYAVKISDPTYRENYQERKVAWIKLSRARLILRKLLADGMLTRDEAFLLGYETGFLQDVVSSSSVSSLQRQYRSSGMPWFKQSEPGDFTGRDSTYPRSYGEVEPWLNVLSKAADNGQLSPAVLKVVLSHIELIWRGSSPPENGHETGLFDPDC